MFKSAKALVSARRYHIVNGSVVYLYAHAIDMFHR